MVVLSLMEKNRVHRSVSIYYGLDGYMLGYYVCRKIHLHVR